MTLPISSSQAERTFSTMRRVRIIFARQWVMRGPVSTGIFPHSLPEWAFRARPGLWRIFLCPKVSRIAEHKFGSRYRAKLGQTSCFPIMGPKFGDQYGNKLGSQLGPMSITKLSPNWAYQMGPIHFINFYVCPNFALTAAKFVFSNSGNFRAKK